MVQTHPKNWVCFFYNKKNIAPRFIRLQMSIIQGKFSEATKAISNHEDVLRGVMEQLREAQREAREAKSETLLTQDKAIYFPFCILPNRAFVFITMPSRWLAERNRKHKPNP